MMIKSIIVPLLLTLVAGLSWWILSLQKTPPSHQNSPIGPDYYLEEFSSVSMDAKGFPKEKLEAMRLTHFPIDDHTELLLPRITVTRSKDTQYVVLANKGTLLSGTNTLRLQGKVEIQRYTRSKRSAQMFTEELWIQSNANLAYTDMPVKLVDALGVVNAIGFVADLENNRLELLHQVRGTYYANP